MELPKRKPNRLKGYDYSNNGAYFVTVCAKNRQEIFGSVIADAVGADNIRPKSAEEKIHLSKTGELVKTAIESINTYYPYANIDKYIIMPNHIHILIVINDTASDGRIISAPTGENKKRLEIIIGQMKRWASRQAGIPLWEKSFHDHIIRTDNDYNDAWNYIDSNPRLWLEEKK